VNYSHVDGGICIISLPVNHYQGGTYSVWIYMDQLLFAKVASIQIQKGVSGRVRRAGILLFKTDIFLRRSGPH
jgi:hypothetical protein